MSRVILYIATSLDGCIADADGGVDWLESAASPEDGDYGYAEFYASVGSLVMGRTTYEQVRGFGDWPYPGKPTRVFTHQALEGAHPDVEFVAGDPRPVLEQLFAWGDVWLVGGAELVRGFRELGLVDETILTVLPVILGAGPRLYPEGGLGESLELLEAKSWPSGFVQLRYRQS